STADPFYLAPSGFFQALGLLAFHALALPRSLVHFLAPRVLVRLPQIVFLFFKPPHLEFHCIQFLAVVLGSFFHPSHFHGFLGMADPINLRLLLESEDERKKEQT